MSAISAISLHTVPEITQPPVANGYSTASAVVNSLQSISSALQSGDVATAEQAYGSLSQLLGSVNSGSPGPALTALGQALQKGNISAAEKALSAVSNNILGILQAHAATQGAAGNSSGVTRIDALISQLETIPGVSANTASSASIANPPADNGASAGGPGGVNVVA
ncbi:MAG TPA: hypothetical protein VKS22_01435 [Candidatus Binataceae bacterium]|nr:hypothetical protein [Candidatus Binataceae bacterium]